VFYKIVRQTQDPNYYESLRYIPGISRTYRLNDITYAPPHMLDIRYGIFGFSSIELAAQWAVDKGWITIYHRPENMAKLFGDNRGLALFDCKEGARVTGFSPIELPLSAILETLADDEYEIDDDGNKILNAPDIIYRINYWWTSYQSATTNVFPLGTIMAKHVVLQENLTPQFMAAACSYVRTRGYGNSVGPYDDPAKTKFMFAKSHLTLGVPQDIWQPRPSLQSEEKPDAPTSSLQSPQQSTEE